MDDTNEALKIWGALKPMIDAEIAEKTTSCVRSKKMNVVSAPSGTTIGVCEPFDTKIYHIPYVSSIKKASVGDTVWVKWYFNNASTMIATSYGDGLDDVSYPLPFSLGGTGATSKTNAKSALDIDDLENALDGTRFIQKYCAKSASLSFTFSGQCNFVIFTDGGVQALRSIIWGHCTSGGSVAANKTNAASSSDITLTTSVSNKLTIANGNTSYQLNVLLIAISGASNIS